MNNNAAKQRLEELVKEVLKEGLSQLDSYSEIKFFRRQEDVVYHPPCVLVVCEDCPVQDGLEEVMMYEADVDIYITTTLAKVDKEGDAVAPTEDHTTRTGELEQFALDPLKSFVDKLNNTERVWVHYAEPGSLESMNTERTWVDKVPIKFHFQHIVE